MYTSDTFNLLLMKLTLGSIFVSKDVMVNVGQCPQQYFTLPSLGLSFSRNRLNKNKNILTARLKENRYQPLKVEKYTDMFLISSLD